MDEHHRESAERVRSLIAGGMRDPSQFRATLERVPRLERDAWVDHVLELGAPPDDGPDLPQGCVPYLPCPVDAILRVAEQVLDSDVFVDIGSGAGRAVALVHLLTGAKAVGVEVQPALVSASRELATRLRLSGVSFVEGDAAQLPAVVTPGSVFFLYCPFSGERLERLLASLETIARSREIRVCCVDLPLPPCDWLEVLPASSEQVTIHRSTGTRALTHL